MSEPFVWGTTSSSVASEGAAPASDWAAWERAGRAPPSLDGNGWGTDHLDDIALLAALGVGALRITLEWARLEPSRGQVDGDRVEHERRVLEAMRDAGLQPWVTLHDGALPGWFADDERGFRDERARGYFWPRHVDRCAEWFGDLVAGWTPIEDAAGWALRAFLRGSRPPGRRDPEQARAAVLGAMEANHLAWRLLRGGGAPVLCALGLPDLGAKVPAEADADAAAWARVAWDTPVGALRDGILDVPGGAVLERPEMAGSFDLVGAVHVHRPGDDTGGFDAGGAAASLSEIVRRLAEELPDRPVAVASHGVTTTDDRAREALLRATFGELDSLHADGVDLRAYFHHTGIDGYDWVTGFARATGLVTRSREVKDSGQLLRERLGE